MTWSERLLIWGSVFVYCFIIFLFSSQSDFTLPNDTLVSDKTAHILEYSGLGWLCALALRRERQCLSAVVLVLFSASFAAVYGASDEWHQAYVPGRFSDYSDLLADIVGGTLGGAWHVFCSHIWGRSGDASATSLRT